ncbi:hypothetical protein CMQ_6232 [Grosmannia clavigera kw1407]|uniref:Uncharacterized protein n=1 Tax=Grosmannia clavigera (strain kw1407 / UAMH 11150) TaxID=655863 RepID=F0XMK6_GROCL|nr:uncharacterized protein CMQ_6232 [Grosmannia clavigera kw1407]EFX01290.1 hypothetical protein CMQ_6232 [Grosmannia clavigera kw1407]
MAADDDAAPPMGHYPRLPPSSTRPPSTSSATSISRRSSCRLASRPVSRISIATTGRRRRIFTSPPPPLRLLQQPVEQPFEIASALRPFQLSRQVHDYDEIARLRIAGLAARDARLQQRNHRPDSLDSLDGPRYVAEGDLEMRAMLLGPLAQAENALLDQRTDWSRRHRRVGNDHSHRHSYSYSYSYSLGDVDDDDKNGDSPYPVDSAIAKAIAALASRKMETEFALQTVQLGGSSSSNNRPVARKPKPQPQRQPQPQALQLPQLPPSPLRQLPAAVISSPAPPPTPPLSPQRHAYDKEAYSTAKDSHKRDSFWRGSIQSVISWRPGQ